jgi:hypothetical protein
MDDSALNQPRPSSSNENSPASRGSTIDPPPYVSPDPMKPLPALQPPSSCYSRTRPNPRSKSPELSSPSNHLIEASSRSPLPQPFTGASVPPQWQFLVRSFHEGKTWLWLREFEDVYQTFSGWEVFTETWRMYCDRWVGQNDSEGARVHAQLKWMHENVVCAFCSFSSFPSFPLYLEIHPLSDLTLYSHRLGRGPSRLHPAVRARGTPSHPRCC